MIEQVGAGYTVGSSIGATADVVSQTMDIADGIQQGGYDLFQTLKSSFQGGVAGSVASVVISKLAVSAKKIKTAKMPKSSNANKTLLSGEEWYRYFQDKYGVENVTCGINSFDDILQHLSSLRMYNAEKIAQILGDGWTKGSYGRNGSGWKFIQNAHPENSVFYHGGGLHVGSYYGVSSGASGKIKIADVNTYVPRAEDRATIIYNEDW